MLRPDNVTSFVISYYKAICDSESNSSRWPLSDMYLLDAIPSKSLINAKNTYANIGEETPLLLISTSFWGSGKSGILLTDACLYFKLTEKERSRDTLAEISLDRISKISVENDCLLINHKKYSCDLLYNAEKKILIGDFFNRLSSGLSSVEKESVEKIWKPDRYSKVISQIFEGRRDEFFYKLAQSITPNEEYLSGFSTGSQKVKFTSERVIIYGGISSQQQTILRSEVTGVTKVRKGVSIPGHFYKDFMNKTIGPNPYMDSKKLSELGIAIGIEMSKYLAKQGAEKVISLINNKWSIVIKTNRYDYKRKDFESIMVFEELEPSQADLALAAAKRAGISVDTI